MFKVFFKNVSTYVKKTYKKITKSKVMKFVRKVLTGIGIGAVVVTAFNVGNISEALTHMVDGPTTVMDAVRWTGVMCGNMIADIKAKNITWEIKRIFAPAVTAVAFIGGKILNQVHKVVTWFKNANKAMKKSKDAQKAAEKSADVVNLFA